MSRRRHAVHEEEHENHERWLLTYADLITLLLALFMMLYAMSVLDLKKYEAFQEAFTQGMGKHVHSLPGEGDPPNGEKLQTQPGALVGKPDPSPSPVSDQLKPVLDTDGLRKLKKRIDAAITTYGLQDQVQVTLDARGLVVNVVSGVLFSSGSATVSKGGQKLLDGLGAVFNLMANPLVIEGHTDSRPISSALFPSNWELSTSRATAVLRYFISHDEIAIRRVSAAGYADTRPRASNATEAGMAENRRVDIVVLAGPKKPAPAPSVSSSPSATASPTPLPTATLLAVPSATASPH